MTDDLHNILMTFAVSVAIAAAIAIGVYLCTLATYLAWETWNALFPDSEMEEEGSTADGGTERGG